jgi:eukaryotic-like serine/threonine-protein kinase
MSPEQAAGKPTDLRSDVYSLGATAYFLLGGAPPFEGTIMEVIAAHLMQEPPLLSSVNPDMPADLEAIIMRCLAKKPNERFSSVVELDAALAACACANEWNQADAARWWEERSL